MILAMLKPNRLRCLIKERANTNKGMEGNMPIQYNNGLQQYNGIRCSYVTLAVLDNKPGTLGKIRRPLSTVSLQGQALVSPLDFIRDINLADNH